MSIRLFLARLTRKVGAAATVVAVWAGGSASAADVVPPPPRPAMSVFDTSPIPALPPSLGCESCKPGGVGHVLKHGGATLGKHLSHKKGPYPVHLCPGSCFGYFQTQWRKWEDVCPYPYVGTGPTVTSAGQPLPLPGAPLTPPRPVDPKTGDPKMPEPKKPETKKLGGSDLPLIPVPVSGKLPR
jgi:hypothetical protein